MSWRDRAVLETGYGAVYHLSDTIFTDKFSDRPLCHVSLKYKMYHSTIREARERGLRLCKKCRARADEVFARLLEVDGEVGPDVQ